MADRLPFGRSVEIRRHGEFGNARVRAVIKPIDWYFDGLVARQRFGEDGGVTVHSTNGSENSMAGRLRRMDGRPGPPAHPAPNTQMAFRAAATNGEPQDYEVLEMEIVGGRVTSFRNGVEILTEIYPELPPTGEVALRLITLDHTVAGMLVRSVRVLPLDENGDPLTPQPPLTEPPPPSPRDADARRRRRRHSRRRSERRRQRR